MNLQSLDLRGRILKPSHSFGMSLLYFCDSFQDMQSKDDVNSNDNRNL